MMNEASGEGSASGNASATLPPKPEPIPAEEAVPEEEEEAEETQAPWVRDDELIVKYLKYWIPQFTDIFQNTLYTRFLFQIVTILLGKSVRNHVRVLTTF